MGIVKVDLGGFYTYSAYNVIGDDGTMPKFVATINEAENTIQGSGADHPGSFVIAGVLVGDEVRFIKQYVNSNGNVAWKYVGKRLEPKGVNSNVYQFSGGWGQGTWQGGQWVLSGVAPNPPQKPTHPIVGHWEGNYRYANNVAQNDGPMSITIALDDSVAYTPSGPFALKGTGTDGIGSFTLKGTLSASNDLDVEKTYHTGSGSWSWRYQGRYDDGAGTINGIWREIRDDEAAARGDFDLVQRNAIPRATAQAIMPQAQLYAVQPQASIETAIQAAARTNPQVSAATLQSLLTGFSSK